MKKQEQVQKEPKESKDDSIQDLPGVGVATAIKLKEAGFANLMSIATASPGQLVEASGVGESVARKIINTARDSFEMGFETGEDLLKRRKAVIKIQTGSKVFNTLVGGGFETGTITEAYGQYGVGKSQVAHEIAVTAQLPIDKGGTGGVVVFIDTESTFRPERIMQIAKEKGLNPEKTLKNIMVARAFNSDHQILLAEKVQDLIDKKELNVKLVIVDSLTAHFRAEFVGRGTLADRQQKLNKHMHTLMKLADTNNLCVYVTNQVMSKPDVFFGDPTEAIGGHVVAHNSQTRIYLRKGKKGSRVAKLVDSPHLADGEAMFFVDEGGLRDV